MKPVYLDNNATTQVAPEVVEAMLPFFNDLYGNPSSAHAFGGQVQKKVDQARGAIASFFQAQPWDIVFTSCGTESDNTAIRSALQAQPGKRHIVTTRVEHPAILSLCQHLEKHEDCSVTYLAVDNQGRLDLDQIKESITDETAIVSVMWANNETGVVFPIPEIAEIVKSKGVIFHSDAVQAVGKLPIDLTRIPVDMLSLVRTQAPRAQGHRGALHPQGDQVLTLHDRRPPGAGPQGRDRERALHHRPGQGL